MDFKRQTCRSCRTRECCWHFDVALNARDMARIARALEVDPEHFCAFVEATDPHDPAAFLLRYDSPRYQLVLLRRDNRSGQHACTFLLELNTRRKVCGLGPLAPTTCRQFPVLDAPNGGPPALYDGPGCWRRWTPDELDLDAERRAATDRRREDLAFHAIVADWNALVLSTQTRYSFEAFCAFLLNREPEGA